jgi:hypothetical protein
MRQMQKAMRAALLKGHVLDVPPSPQFPPERQPPCDHCARPSRFLYTHIIPRRIRPDGHPQDMTDMFGCLVLCPPCGERRRADLKAFLRGAPPSDLVCLDR